MTKDQLQSLLIAEQEWRVQELSLCKKIPFLYMQPTFRPQLSVYWKFCVPMIYAHWEGFVVAAMKLIVDYINGMQIPYNVAPQYLICLDNKTRFGYLQGNCTIEQQERFLCEFFNAQSLGIRIEGTAFSANSNLNFKQLERMLFYLHLSPSLSINSNKSIIEKLVWYRNSIAHGENCITVTQKDIESFINAITTCFDEIIHILLLYIDDLHTQTGM